jgi:hypothetical protein
VGLIGSTLDPLDPEGAPVPLSKGWLETDENARHPA